MFAYPIWEWDENHTFQRDTLGSAIQFYNVNAVQASHWDEIHSGMKVIMVSYKKPLISLFPSTHQTIAWNETSSLNSTS